jgi:predicted XRE-type DNA-binding protein
MPLPFLVGQAIVTIATTVTAAAVAKKATSTIIKTQESKIYSRPSDVIITPIYEEESPPLDIEKEVASHMPTIEERLLQLKQAPPQRINEDVESIMQLLSVNESNLQKVESQGWFKRVWGTVSGGNKRLEKVNAQNLQIVQKLSLSLISKLEQQNMITREIITIMNGKLNEIAEGQLELKGFIEAVINRVADRFEQVEGRVNFHDLLKEIELGFFNKNSSTISLLLLANELKDLCPLDPKQTKILDGYVKKANMTSTESRPLEEFLIEVANMNKEEQQGLSQQLAFAIQGSSHPVCQALGVALAFGLEDLNKRMFKRFEPTLEEIRYKINTSIELSSEALFGFLLEWLNGEE